MIYKRIRDLREWKNLSQKQVGQILNVAQRTYSRYENGERTIPTEVLLKLADFHETSVDYILGRTDIKESYPKASIKAVNKLLYVSADEKLRYELDIREEDEPDYWSVMKTNYDKGRIEGETKGKLESALNIIKVLNVSVSKAMEITNLPAQAYEKLISELVRLDIPYEN